MRTPPTLVLVLLLSVISALSQTAPSPTQSNSLSSEAILAQAIAAFSRTPVSLVHLTGTARAIAGSTDESGTFTFDVKQDGESTLSLNAGVLTRSETVGAFGGGPACTWSRADGVQHNSAQHNCLLPLHWILPALGLQAQANKLQNSLDDGTDQGVSVHTLSINQRPPDASLPGQRFTKLSSAKLSLDAATLLPSSLSFDIHPDNNELINIPIVVRYSDYRQVNGASIPFHIQKFLNNGLVLDFHVESAEVQQ